MVIWMKYRYLNGWSAMGKRDQQRHERYPFALADSLLLRQKEDYEGLLPIGSMFPFTSQRVCIGLQRIRNKNCADSCLTVYQTLARYNALGKVEGSISI
jgi:hypothetical protein